MVKQCNFNKVECYLYDKNGRFVGFCTVHKVKTRKCPEEK